MHTDGPLPQMFDGTIGQFRELSRDGVVIKISEGDNCIDINNVVVLVQNIILFKGSKFVVFREYSKKESLFDYPISSCELGISVVSDLSLELKCSRLRQNILKYVRLPLEGHGKFAVFPLLHLK